MIQDSVVQPKQSRRLFWGAIDLSTKHTSWRANFHFFISDTAVNILSRQESWNRLVKVESSGVGVGPGNSLFGSLLEGHKSVGVKCDDDTAQLLAGFKPNLAPLFLDSLFFSSFPRQRRAPDTRTYFSHLLHLCAPLSELCAQRKIYIQTIMTILLCAGACHSLFPF